MHAPHAMTDAPVSAAPAAATASHTALPRTATRPGAGEFVPGGTVLPGPSMVPTHDAFSTPTTSAAAAMAAAALPSCGPLPTDFTSYFLPPSAAHAAADGAAAYPTPGVAYADYSAPHSALPHPPGEALAIANGQLEAALQEVARLSLVTGVSSPLVRSPLTLPAMHLGVLPEGTYTRPPERPHRSPNASRASSVVSFPSYSSSGSSCALSSADTEVMLPPPAAEVAAGALLKVTKQDDIFSSKDLSSLLCTCKKDAVAGWDVTIMGRIKAKCGAAHRVLTYTDAELAALPAAAAAIARGYDSMLAGHFLATLQGDTPEVRLRRSIIASREAKAPGTFHRLRRCSD